MKGLYAVFYDGAPRPAAGFALEQHAEEYAREYSGGVSYEVKRVQVAPEWQPIETVPRDGTSVLIGHANSVWADHWIAYSSTSDAGYWSEGGDAEFPTHWMPLPEPPLERLAESQ